MKDTIALALLLLAAPSARAKEGFSVGAGAEAAYDGNVWLLADDKLDKPGTDTKSDDKYYDMESATDTVLSFYGRLDWEFRAAGGKKSRLRVQPGASLYMQNSRKTHVSLAGELTHDVWKGGDVFVRGGLVPARFRKNYLVTADPDGSSKRYDQGVSTDAEVAAGVESRITKSLDGKLWVGGGAEGFHAPFENRSQAILEGGGSLGLEIGKRVGVGLAVRRSMVSTGSDTEVTIEGGQRVDTSVDRSYDSNTVSPSLEVELSKAIDIRAEYGYRSRSFTSSGTNDPYRGRADVRHTGTTELRIRVAKPLRLDVGAQFARVITDRPNDEDRGSDEVDYQRIAAWVGLVASF